MITIRLMQEQNIDFIIECLQNTDVNFMNQWGGGRWYTYPVTKEQITNQFNTRKENTLYFIILNGEQMVGSAELDFINWDKKECAICRFLIAEEYRSKGLGTQALKKLTEYAFEKLDMGRVHLSVFDFNIGAIKCYQNAGFIECGRDTRPNGWVAIKMEKNKCKDYN